jgi:predicted DNA-binding transcriptional regulator AlpA
MSLSPSTPGAVDWLDLDAAVEISGKSKATFYRFVRAGSVRTLQVPRAGSRPQTLFARADAERLATSNEPAPQVEPMHDREPRAPRRLLLAAPVADPPPIASAGAPRPILRLPEVVAEFGLPASYVRELLQKKHVAAVRRGTWFISRASLEAFIANGFRAVKASAAARRAPR